MNKFEEEYSLARDAWAKIRQMFHDEGDDPHPLLEKEYREKLRRLSVLREAALSPEERFRKHVEEAVRRGEET